LCILQVREFSSRTAAALFSTLPDGSPVTARTVLGTIAFMLRGADFGQDTITFSLAQAQYVRLAFPGGAGAATPQIDEVAVTGP
jgi:hypothetical protein